MGDRQAELQQQRRELEVILQAPRVAMDLDKNRQYAATHFNMSIEATKRDMHLINTAFGTRDLVLDPVMKQRLTDTYNRAEAHVLINEYKSGLGSLEMRGVRTSILEVETLLGQEVQKADTEFFDKLRGAYASAIESCIKYCNKRPPHFAKGKERRAIVERSLRRLLNESARIEEIRAYYDRGAFDGNIHKGSDLLYLGKLHNFTVDFKAVQTHEQAEEFNRKRLAAQQQAPDKKKEKPKKQDPTVTKLLRAMTIPEEKWSYAKKRTANDAGKLRRALSEFPVKGLHSVSMEFDGKLVSLTQDDEGNLIVKVGDYSEQLPESARLLRDRIESRMVELQSDMNPADMLELINTQIRESAGDVVRSRALCARYLQLKTGEPATLFNNLGTQELRQIAYYVAEGGDLQKAIEAAKSFEKEALVNGSETLDILRRLQEEGTEVATKVTYASDRKMSEMTPAEAEEAKKKALDGWTEDEFKLKDMISDMIFSYDTWEADETLAKPGERMYRVLLKNTDILSKLYVDTNSGKQDEETIIGGLMKKLPLQAMGMDGEGLLGMLRGTLAMVNTFVDAQLALLALDPANEEEIRKIRTNPAELKKLLDDGLQTEEVHENLAPELAELEKEIDDYVEDGSEALQEQVNEAVKKVFGDSPELEELQEQAGREAQQAARGQQQSGTASDRSDTSQQQVQQKSHGLTDEEAEALDPELVPEVMKEATIGAGADLLNKLLEDSVKGNSGQGLFIKQAFKHYFSGVNLMDKRTMFASAFRNAKPKQADPAPIQRPEGPLSKEEKDELDKKIAKREEDIDKAEREAMGNLLGGLLKGAGPLFQKMLQGLPTDGMPPELRGALDDVKSKLAPIPRPIVDAQLLGMIERSGGKVTRIDVEKALGAASVGQTFLCRMYGPDLPQEGRPVVVKLLKPDVRNRMMREKKLMTTLARRTDIIQRLIEKKPALKDDEKGGMEATYEGQLSRIEEELDLTIEARNVVKGAIYDESSLKDKTQSDGVSSMKLNELVAPTVNAMVLEKAPGTTLDRYMSDLREEQKALMRKFVQKDAAGNPSVDSEGNPVTLIERASSGTQSRELAEARIKMQRNLDTLIMRQKYIATLSKKWVTEGVFGKGFYHGDLHAGNIMIDDNGATIIDFGNATALSEEQQKNVTLMVGAAAVGDMEGFRTGLHNLLDPQFEDTYKAVKDRFGHDIANIFRLGDKSSAGQRIGLALLKAQEYNLQVPSAIFNFSQCQLRLQNAMDSMDKQIADLRLDIAKLDRVKTSTGLVDVDVFISRFTQDERPVKEFDRSGKANLEHDFNVVYNLIGSFDTEDQERFTWVATKSSFPSGFANVDSKIDGFKRMLVGDAGRLAQNLDKRWAYSGITGTVSSTFNVLEQFVDCRDLRLRSEKVVADLRQNLVDGKADAMDVFNTAIDEIVAKLKERSAPIADLIQKQAAYKTASEDKKTSPDKLKKLEEEFVAAYKPFMKLVFLGGKNTSMIRENFRGVGKDATHFAMVDQEVDFMVKRDPEIGPELRSAYDEYKQVRDVPYDDIDKYLEKENKLMEVMRKYTLKHLREYQQLSLHNLRARPQGFVDVMSDAIVDNITTSMARLGLRSIKYRSKLS